MFQSPPTSNDHGGYFLTRALTTRMLRELYMVGLLIIRTIHGYHTGHINFFTRVFKHSAWFKTSEPCQVTFC